MRQGHARQANKLIQRREILRNQIQQLAQKKRLSREEKLDLDALKTTYYSVVTTYDLSYPPPHAGIMPTKFGNILKASEAYAGTRYGIDSVQFWPRLWPLLKQSLRRLKPVFARIIRGASTDRLQPGARDSAATRSLQRIVRIRWVQNLNLPTPQMTKAWKW